MNQIELQHHLEAHKRWLESQENATSGQRGKQLVLKGEHLADIQLNSSDFSGAKLSGCEFVNCRFEGCNFFNAELIAAKSRNCQFSRCQFTKADLRGLKAENCNFSGSDFTRADLTDAVLTGCVLTDCILDWAWLVRTDLRFANITGVSMENARLLRTKLYNEKQFQFALPSKITVREVDVSPTGDDTRLEGIEGLTRLQLRTR